MKIHPKLEALIEVAIGPANGREIDHQEKQWLLDCWRAAGKPVTEEEPPARQYLWVGDAQKDQPRWITCPDCGTKDARIKELEAKLAAAEKARDEAIAVGLREVKQAYEFFKNWPTPEKDSIRDEALEDAARIADEEGQRWMVGEALNARVYVAPCLLVSKRIRSLKKETK